MRRIFLPVKSGFEVIDKTLPIVIRDNRGLSFYDTNPIVPKVENFNLPQGEYLIDSGRFRRLPAPINYPLFKLPPPEVFRPKPYRFKVMFGENPNKCSIFWKKKTILFDNQFKEVTKPEFDFIKFHEFGHSRYLTEKFCDLMAANFMLVKGYNPSQIGLAPIVTLSDNNFERKKYLVNKIINYEQRGNK